MVRTRVGLVVTAAFAALASPLSSQQVARPVTQYALAGQVTDGHGGAITDAEVTVTQDGAAARSVRSDTTGRFAMADLVTNTFSVRGRRIGYEARTIPVTIPRSERRASLVVALEPMVTKLPGMSVVETEDEPDARLRDFRARRSTNSFGHYIERDVIDKRRPQYVSEVLRAVPGIYVQASRRIGNNVRIRGCMPLLWLDGVRLPGAELDETVQPQDVAAIEIYNSFAGIPAQFFDRAATCGTVLVWTRSR